ncbi:MAG: FlgD immunoglobulin-like domain containing protein, partial [Candidatus Poribacteria bacterium]
LPKGTIIMQKWGIDGEPTNDPEIKLSFINDISKYGHKVVIISHDVEEVMPLWMIEADLFAEGLRKYSVNPYLNGLGGFTLQGEEGLAILDRIVSSRLIYDPNEDYVSLMRNYLIRGYGEKSAQNILNGLRKNTMVLSDYFSDYAGTLSLTGKYGDGSRGYATRFWNIIGKSAVKDTLSIPNIKTVEYAKERLTSLLPRQQDSANDIYNAKISILTSSDQYLSDYMDCMHLMRMWTRFFASRLCLVEAREIGLKGGTRESLMKKISSAIEYSKEMSYEIAEIKNFIDVFNYTDDSARKSLLDLIDEEIRFLSDVDPEIISSVDDQNENEEKAVFSIKNFLLHPSPVHFSATFCYTLGMSADEVKINVYTISGRLIKTINCISTDKGYNEEFWDTRDEAGNMLSSGTYLYKILAIKDDKKIYKIGKFSVIR